MSHVALTKTPITALIAEDEPLLAQALRNSLKRLWPDLRVLPSVPDGTQALEQALAELPDICFLDIQMPERDGLAVAEALAEQWPQNRPLPRIVFVTAYDEYAVAAFERSAVDYLLKPVQPERLARTCSRLQERFRWQMSHHQASSDFDAAQADEDAASEQPASEDLPDEDSALLSAVRALSAVQHHQADETGTSAPLRMIPVAVGQHLQLVDVNDVLYFEAADKYVRLITREADASTAAWWSTSPPSTPSAASMAVCACTFGNAQKRSKSAACMLRCSGPCDVAFFQSLHRH
jgi:DNA-binding LytR/AlgR family response regulator